MYIITSKEKEKHNINRLPPAFILNYDNEKEKNIISIDIYTHSLKVHIYPVEKLQNKKHSDLMRYLYVTPDLLNKLAYTIETNIINWEILNQIIAKLFKLYLKQLTIIETIPESKAKQFIINHDGINNIKLTRLNWDYFKRLTIKQEIQSQIDNKYYHNLIKIYYDSIPSDINPNNKFYDDLIYYLANDLKTVKAVTNQLNHLINNSFKDIVTQYNLMELIQ